MRCSFPADDTPGVAAYGPLTISALMARRILLGRAAVRTAELPLEVVGDGAFNERVAIERAFRKVRSSRFRQ